MTDSSYALELFKRFQPKFREVEWMACGFYPKSKSFAFCPSNKGSHYTWMDHSTIDLSPEGANLTFPFTFDPAGEHSPAIQMDYAAWDVIVRELLVGRAFFADPESDEDVECAFTRLILGRREVEIPVRFSHDGESIPGIRFTSNLSAKHWRFFVPGDSPEGRALETAVELERAKTEQQRREQEEPVTEVLKARLEEELAAIPA